jgi:hypothetical protein
MNSTFNARKLKQELLKLQQRERGIPPRFNVSVVVNTGGIHKTSNPKMIFVNQKTFWLVIYAPPFFVYAVLHCNIRQEKIVVTNLLAS